VIDASTLIHAPSDLGTSGGLTDLGQLLASGEGR
jgi:hypothetical protein